VDAWNFSDHELYRSLTAYLGTFANYYPWQIDLYTNVQNIPLPVTAGAYTLPTQAQWPGYAGVSLVPQNWGRVDVANRIATSTYPQLVAFPLTAAIPALSIYGYVIVDIAGNYKWSEQWGEPLVLTQPYTFLLQVRLNQGVLVVSDPSAFLDEDDDD
jgi:hypothetical protein